MVSEVGEVGAAERVSEEGGRQGRSRVLRWLLFQLACAAVMTGLMWLGPVVPLYSWIRNGSWFLAVLILPFFASFLVPVVWRIPRHRRRVVWQIVPAFLAGALLAGVSGGAGSNLAMQERGKWTQAEVVALDDRPDRCVLQKPDGRKISPDLTEGNGCDGGVRTGDVLRVRYDPKGAVEPWNESWKPRSHAGVIAGAAAVFLGFGTWSFVRLDRRRRELDNA